MQLRAQLLLFSGQGGVFKVRKNNLFLEFLAVWVLFRKFLSRLKSGSCKNCTKS